MMHRELNKNDFFKAKRGYDLALEMMEQGCYRECLLELKIPFLLLQQNGIQTRMLAKCLLLKSDALQALQEEDKATEAAMRAVETLQAIGDHSDLYDQAKKKAGLTLPSLPESSDQ